MSDLIRASSKATSWYVPHLELTGAGESELILRARMLALNTVISKSVLSAPLITFGLVST